MFDGLHPAADDTHIDYCHKIVPIEALQKKLAAVRGGGGAGAGKKVVQCHGCFDIVHPGHIRYLQFARTQGDILVVSITGDALINKGAQRPYIPQELRAENLAALQFVDFVVVDPHPTACEILQAIRPDFYVKGHEYATSNDPRFLAERRIVESYGGRVVFSSGQVVFSSSKLLDTTAMPTDLSDERLNLICRRHGIEQGCLGGFLDEMQGRRIVVVGDSTIERYAVCDANHMTGESPMMSLRVLSEKDYLGGAAFVAAQAAALGAKTVLFTSLARDAASAWIEESLGELGVEVRAIRNRSDTVSRTRFMVDEHKMFKVERANACPLDSAFEAECAELLLQEAVRTDVAILHDGGLGMLTPGLLNRLGMSFRKRVPFISGAASSLGNLSQLRHFELLCTSERRLRAALHDFDSGLSTLAYRLMERTQARQMIITLGKRGLVTFSRRSDDPESAGWKDRLGSEHLPALSGHAVDRLGAGDSLLTGTSLALAGGANLMQSAYIGSVAANVQVSRLGLEPATSESIFSNFKNRPELFAVPAEAGIATSLHPLEAQRSHEFQPV